MKKICILGGGHGTSRLIKGFKDVNAKIDIIVTSSDNGGHSGEIIKEFNVPAIGDLRMVLESISNQPLKDLFAYRFKNLHGNNNISLGNLILLALILETGSVDRMLEIINKEIDNKYHLYLANNEYLELKGIDRNNNLIEGEVAIGNCSNIKELYFENEGIVNEEVIRVIKEADLVVLSFGSFFTSLGAIIANKKIKEALHQCTGKIIYLPNLVNQKETKGFVVEDYVDYLESKLEKKIDKVLISNSKIKRKYVKKYQKVNKEIVIAKVKRDNYYYYPLLIIEDNKLRHNVDYLAEIITKE